MLAACYALIAAIALIDLFTWNINLPILYSLPLVLHGHLYPQRTPWPLVIVLVVLTFAGFLLGPGGLGGAFDVTLSYRLINRTLAAITIAIIGALQQLGVMASREIERAGQNPRRASVSDLMGVVDQLRITAIALVITLCIAALDMLSPATFNLPILYAVPLLASLQARSRPLLWGLAGVLLVLSVLGYLSGVPGTPVPIHNRLIAAACILLVAWMGHRWLGSAPRAVADPAATGA